MCVGQDGFFYMLGGKSANLPMKDLWRFDPGRCMHMLSMDISLPPCLPIIIHSLLVKEDEALDSNRIVWMLPIIASIVLHSQEPVV